MRDVAIERTRSVEHVRTHPAGGFAAVALGDRAHHRVMFRTRLGEAAVLAELHAAERVEPRANFNRLLRQEVVVRGAVDRLVELAVKRIVCIDVACIDRRFAGFVDAEQAAAFEAAGGFPSLYRIALPALAEARHRSADEEACRVHALMALFVETTAA